MLSKTRNKLLDPKAHVFKVVQDFTFLLSIGSATENVIKRHMFKEYVAFKRIQKHSYHDISIIRPNPHLYTDSRKSDCERGLSNARNI